MTYGLTDAGFVKKPLPDILTGMQAKELANISPEQDLSTDSPMGQINGIFAAEIAELWDLGEELWAALDPDAATGAAQDAVCAVTGTVRDGATKSKVTCTVNLNAGVTLSATVAKCAVQGNPAALFVLTADVTNSSGSPASLPAIFEATVTGPVVANAGTLTVIMTPTSGWNSVTNPADAVRGTNIELDPHLRTKRDQELTTEGSSPPDALRADLLELDGVLAASVFENTTNVTDANGLPPHSIECLVFDGVTPALSNDVIAQRIWDSRGGGIQTYGATTGNAVDALGVTRTMSFSRPNQEEVYFVIDIRIDSTKFPGSGDSMVQTNVAAKGIDREAGDPVILASFYATIFAVTGVVDIIAFRAGFAPSPIGTTNLTVGPRDLATFDTSRIIINHV